MRINCFEPDIDEKDIRAATTTIKSKILAFGSNVEKFEKKYSKFSNKKYNIGFNSASSAAYLLFQYLYEKYGACDIFTPSIGFVSPVFAAIKNGHNVEYVDVDKDALFCSKDLASKMSSSNRQKVVMPVLYGGVSKIPGLTKAIQGTDSILVLDSAHCISPSIDYDYAFYSFHPVKPICMSNGGLLSTNSKAASNYMYSGRNFGRKVIGDTYDLVQQGFNFYMNNLNAALGLSQIEKCITNVDKRRKNLEFLRNNMPKDLGYITKHDKQSSYYLSTLILKDGDSSAILRKYLRAKGIGSGFHYPLLHKTEHYRKISKLPVTDSMQDRLINLPIHQNLSEKEMEIIIDECIHYSRSGS